MLTRVAIHNYSCFVDFELELPRRLLLVGSNGSGKTSLWYVLAGLQDVIVRGVEVSAAFPTSARTRWLPDDPVQRFELSVQVGDIAYEYRLELLHDLRRQRPTIQLEQLRIGEELLYRLDDGEVWIAGDATDDASFPFGRKRSFLSELEAGPKNARVLAFRDEVASFWLLAHAPPNIEPTTSEEAVWLERDGSNFSSWFRGATTDDLELGSRLNEALRPVLPGLQRLSFEKISQKVRELMLRFRSEGGEYVLSASELSDGQRSLLLLYGLLVGALPHARVAFLDEPEAGLAPHEMQPWLAAAAEALAGHDGQLIVSSHHPAVIDYLAPERTIGLSRPGGGRTRLQDITLETTGGSRVSDWLARSWAYEDEHVEPET